MSRSLCFSMPITNTFGLSQPSRSAECEKMNRTGSSKGEQPLLVLQDQIVRVYVVRLGRPSPVARIRPMRLLFLSMEK